MGSNNIVPIFNNRFCPQWEYDIPFTSDGSPLRYCSQLSNFPINATLASQCSKQYRIKSAGIVGYNGTEI